VGPDDLKLIKIVDTEDEVVEVLDEAAHEKRNKTPTTVSLVTDYKEPS
jgi:hypothetical protein